MTESTQHMPATPRWEFDATVADCFIDMLERSIPQYEIMGRAVVSLAQRHLVEQSSVIDLGCSWGTALATVREAAAARFGDDRGGVRFQGLEVSAPMVEKAAQLFVNDADVSIECCDLRDWRPASSQASVVLAVLTLQFTPINYRQQIVRRAYESLRPGGVFIMVEKVLGQGAALDDLMADIYHESKAANGYSQAAIDAKRRALEGVLVPITASMNESILRGAAFHEIDCFWRWMNFAGWVAVR